MLIDDILSGFSDGELAALAGIDAVRCYEKITGDFVDKSSLIRAVKTQLGFELVSQDSRRRLLIDRMSFDQVNTAIDEMMDGSAWEMSDNRDPYEVLAVLSERWTPKFVKIMGFSGTLQAVSDASVGTQGILPVLCKYPLYPYQRSIVRKVSSLFDDGGGKRCLVHLPTGAGKTRTAMNIAAEHLRACEDGLVLWLADTSELCSQAAEEFNRAWTSLGNRDTKIYSYYGDTDISLGGIEDGFLVAGLQKIHSARGKNELGVLYQQLQKNVSLIIFDEAHKAIARTYKQVVSEMMGYAENTKLLGLTATPGRKLEFDGGEDEELARFFHNNKITMNVPGYSSPIKYLVDNKYLAKAEFINVEYAAKKIMLADEFSNQKRSNEILKVLSEDDSRNTKLLDVIREEYNEGGSILVFACSVEHSRLLASLLAFKGIEAYSLDSQHDDTTSRRFKISQYSKGEVRVLVNFNILTAGFDAPITNTVVIARPTDSLVQYSQMAGRAMRGLESKGNENCKIYTVRDDIPAFTSVVRAFKHWDSLWTEV